MIVDEVGRNPPGLLTTDPLVEMKIGAHREMRTSSIEKTQRIRVVTDHDGDSIVVENLGKKCLRHVLTKGMSHDDTHSWYIFTREFVCSVRYQKTGLWPSEQRGVGERRAYGPCQRHHHPQRRT